MSKTYICAAALFSVGAIAWFAGQHPTLALLVIPGLKSRSPYCSRWSAVRDADIKLKAAKRAEEIERAGRLLQTDGDIALWSTPDGEYWIPGNDIHALAIVLAQEERNIYGIGRWAVAKGDTVLDVGAYIGTWTKQALALGARKVIAIEPSPPAIRCLERNLAREIAAGKVVLCPKGIWDSETVLTFFSNSASGIGNSFVEKAEAARAIEKIPVTTIDRLAAELHLARVDFIKADVKGATDRLLRGGSATIQRDRPKFAISTEEPEDKVESIAGIAQQIQPKYQVHCGPCLLDGKDIYTDVLFLQ